MYLNLRAVVAAESTELRHRECCFDQWDYQCNDIVRAQTQSSIKYELPPLPAAPSRLPTVKFFLKMEIEVEVEEDLRKSNRNQIPSPSAASYKLPPGSSP